MNKTIKTANQTAPRNYFAFALMALLAFMPGLAMADDWIADQLRGNVLIYSNGDWVQLQRGDVVSDDRYIRTMGSGRVTFLRGNETIEMAGNTQMRIVDSNGRQFTTVIQDFGSVSIEAEVQNVQHFAVETPFLAAVVKGTRFTVTVGDEDASVAVERGLVQVNDHMHDMSTFIPAGQRVKVMQGHGMQVTGSGQRYMFVADNGDMLTPQEADDKVRGDANNNARGNGNSDFGIAQGNANPGSGNNGNSGNGGNGNSGNGNSSNSNSGNGNGNSSNGNSGNNGNGNSGNGNGNSGNNGNGNGNSGNNGNGNGNSGNNGNGNGNSGNGNGNSGSNGNGNSGNSGNGNSGNGNSGNGNSGNNGNGNGNSGNSGNGKSNGSGKHDDD
ncbi:MAG: FecR domain-containing protein [Hyphomicrobiaceae bacterium]|nr:FecR domain-containing protein [Hyphomicrobiaceae bacterium]